jgi:hypothetical protein
VKEDESEEKNTERFIFDRGRVAESHTKKEL